MGRYIFEITDGPSKDYDFAYFDTKDHLAGFLFAHEHVDVTIEGEYGAEDDPYRIMLCQVPREQRDGFMRYVDMIPGLMAYAGKKDYDDFCMNFMMDAAHFFDGREKAGRSIPLQ